MPYRDPIFFEGGYYHVYSRGSEKRVIFLDRADRERFLNRLKEYKEEHQVDIICYCLMPNHYHLLLKQKTHKPVSVFISRLNLSYAMYFNKRYDRVGPLFQSRFKAKNIDNDEYLIHLSRYIHLNPLTSRGIESVVNYQWSSLKDYLNNDAKIVNRDVILSYFNGRQKEYMEFLVSEADKKVHEMVADYMFEEVSPAQARGLKRAG